jgi:hypothetical protein
MAHLPHLGYKTDMQLPLQAELMKAEASRITQLITHGVVATLMGLMLTVSPRSDVVFFYTNDLPGWPGVYGIIFALSGINLTIRVVWCKKTRNIWWSLVLVAVCYLIFGGLFLINLGKWVAIGMHGPSPIVYPIAVYFGFFALLLLHIEASIPAKKERQHGGVTVN